MYYLIYNRPRLRCTRSGSGSHILLILANFALFKCFCFSPPITLVCITIKESSHERSLVPRRGTRIRKWAVGMLACLLSSAVGWVDVRPAMEESCALTCAATVELDGCRMWRRMWRRTRLCPRVVVWEYWVFSIKSHPHTGKQIFSFLQYLLNGYLMNKITLQQF